MGARARIGSILVALATTACANARSPRDLPVAKDSPKDAFRATPPPLGPAPRAPRLPIDSWRLAEGPTVVLIHRSGPPLATVRIVSRVGAGAAHARAGIVSLMNAALDEGTEESKGTQIARTISGQGAGTRIGTRFDASQIVLSVESHRLESVLPTVLGFITRPTFPPAALTRLGQRRAVSFEATFSSSSTIALNVIEAALYGRAHPYGHSLLGTPTDLRGVTRAEIVAAYDEVWAPSNVAVIVAGDVTRERLAPMVEDAFAQRRARRGAPRVPAVPPVPAEAPVRERLLVADAPGEKRAKIALVDLAAASQSPDRDGLLFLNGVLGSMPSSRMNADLRGAHGYTYGVQTFFDLRQERGPLVVLSDVDAIDVVPALTRMREVFGRMAREGVTANELEIAKRRRTSTILSAYETTEDLTDEIADAFVAGLPLTLGDTDRIEAIQLAEVNRIAAKYMRPDRVKILVVGDLRVIGPTLSKLALGPPAVFDAFGDRRR